MWFTPIAIMLALSGATLAAKPGEGSDLEFGGPGSKPGQLSELRDIVFAKGRMYTLEGSRFDKKLGARVGNLRVQIFDENGKFISQFPVGDPDIKDKDEPARVAVDEAGRVYVTVPLLGLVRRFDASGKPLGTVAIPNATGIVWQKLPAGSRIVVATNPPRPRGMAKGEFPTISELATIDPATGALGEPIKLDKPAGAALQLVADNAGNLYLKSLSNQAFKYDPAGHSMMTLGSGMVRRLGDGSELWHTIAVDSKQRVIAMSPGNPGSAMRFDAKGEQVAMRRGQHGKYDSWGYNGALSFAVDGSDRVWVGWNGDRKDAAGRPDLPLIMRLDADFWDNPKAGVKTVSTLGLGIVVTTTTTLPYNIGYELAEVPVELSIRPGSLRISEATAGYAVYDTWKNVIAEKTFEVKLVEGEEFKTTMSFTPPRWGWYGVVVTLHHGDEFLAAGGTHIGITPKYDGLPALNEGDSRGGWVDPARQSFVGLYPMRLHPGTKLDTFEESVAQAEKFKTPFFAQFTDLKDCTPEVVTEAVTRFKGRVTHWEVMNEPNFSMSVEKYVELIKTIGPLIKNIDPAAVVMGPAHCGVSLDWYRKFYELGGGPFVDVLTIHDYEGHETIDLFHWRWKLGELRKIMAAHGDADKAIWQTERCVSSLRAGMFLGPEQAVRVTMHRDLLESLGIPPGHNMYYYLNEGGYKSVPAYVWSHLGPYPAAMALRTREAMTLHRAYKGMVNWGTTGDRMLLGLKYVGAGGTTLVFRNLGTADLPVTFSVLADEPVELFDAFGNRTEVAVKQGRVTVNSTALPQYLRLAPGRDATAEPIDYGRNVARQAEYTYSSDFQGDLASIANGIFESPHGGDPRRGRYFQGNLTPSPQTLEIRLPRAMPLDHLVIWSLHADNAQCALLDFDLEYHDGAKWALLKQVRTPIPSSVWAPVSDYRMYAWGLDQSFHAVEFPKVTTDRVRIVALRATHGLVPDAATAEALKKNLPPRLMIRELELYGPRQPIETVAEVTAPAGSERSFESAAVSIVVSNRTASPVEAIAKLSAPQGWRVNPPTVSVGPIPGGEKAQLHAELIPPAMMIAGSVPLDVELVDSAGKPLDSERVNFPISPPAGIVPQAIKTMDGSLVQRVDIRNLTSEEWSGVLRVEWIWAGAEVIKPKVVEIPLVPTKSGKTAGIDVPLPRDVAPANGLAWRAEYFVVVDHVSVRVGPTTLPAIP